MGVLLTRPSGLSAGLGVPLDDLARNFPSTLKEPAEV